MIKPLRKRHFYTWAILSVLLPVGFVSAYLVIPPQAISKSALILPRPPAPYKEIVFSSDQEYFLVNIRHQNGLQQLEIVIKKPLIVSSSILYLSKVEQSEIESATLLGTLATRGIYRFNISPGQTLGYLHFYNAVEEKFYQRIKLN